MRRIGLVLIALAALAAAVALGYYLRGSAPERARSETAAPPRPAVSVHAAEVVQRDTQEYQEFAGSVQSRISVQVSSRITAHVVDMKVHSGQQVKKDEVLVRLDDADVKTRIRQAEAEAGAVEAGVRGAEAELAKAQAAKIEAGQDLKRYQELFKAGAAPQQQLQQAEARAKTADAGVDRAQEGIAEARKQVARAQAFVQEAAANLDYTVIRSPMDGIVVEKQAEQGDLAAPGRPLMTLQDPAALWFEAPVSESCARNIDLGSRVRIRIDTEHSDIPAEVSEIVPAVDVKSRSFLVRANMPSKLGLKTGVFGRLQFPCAPRSAVSIRASAKMTQGQLDFVFVIKDGRAQLRLVSTGREHGEWIEVLSGLSAGERIVIDPAKELRDGDPVQEARA